MTGPPTVDEVRAILAESDETRIEALLDAFEGDPRAGVRSAVAAARGRLERARAERERLHALYRLEAELVAGGCLAVAGVDEVGRGALAGPLTAAAVILPPSPHIEGLDDSKRLSPERRERVASDVHTIAVAVAIAHVDAGELDAIGIASAVRQGMIRALGELGVCPDHVVVDGLPVGVADRETAVVKGDATVAAIAAASVVAKVARDALMRSAASEYPEYGFEINKGYGTDEHLRALERFGPSPLHRRSFGPCGGTLSLF